MKDHKLDSEKSFRELEEQLKTIITRLEQGEYEDLEELLNDHSLGVEILGNLQKKLDEAKTRIIKVSAK